MVEKGLLTLRDIAELLGIRYRSVIDCKDFFSEYLSGLHDGRHYRYWSDNLDFIESVFALRDRGYTFAMIKNYLVAEKQGMSSTQALKNLFSSLADSSKEDRGGMKREEDGRGGTRTEKEERGGRRKIEDEGESTWREEEEERGQMMNEEEGGGTRIDNEEGGCERISQDEGGDIMRKEDDRCKEYCNAQFAQLKDEIKRELQEVPCSVQTEILINEKIKILSNALEDTLSKLSEEINDVMIQICKSLNQIKDGTNNIEKRVGQLEKDLGEDQAAGIELNSLDPEKIQVGQPVIKIESEDPCAEIIQPSPGDDTIEAPALQFVKNSIRDGKPDRVAVIEWIKDEKEKNPDTSYAHLAKVLNEAGIPTMSGRDNWGRTVIRKMALEL